MSCPVFLSFAFYYYSIYVIISEIISFLLGFPTKILCANSIIRILITCLDLFIALLLPCPTTVENNVICEDPPVC